MPLESQVTSLSLAKKLKELGVKQESFFWWYQNLVGMVQVWSETDLEEYGSHEAECSAFTVAELGEMLPARIEPNEDWNYFLETGKDSDNWYCAYRYCAEDGSVTDLAFTRDSEEANCRALLLVNLIESKLLTP